MTTFVAANTRSASGSVTVFVPTGTQVGDALILFLATESNPAGFTSVPAGYTLAMAQGANYPYLGVYWKIADQSDIGSNFSAQYGSGTVDMAILAYRGTSTVNPIDTTASARSAGSSQPIPTVSVGAAGEVVLGVATAAGGTIPVAGSGLTARTSHSAGSSGPSTAVADFTQAAAGQTPAYQFTTSGSSGLYTVGTVALRGPNTAPNAPIPTSPANNASVDRSQPIPLTATFSDPDPGDSPSASQWRYRLTGAATWTTVEQDNPLQSYSIPAGLAAGDYEWQAAYADQSGVWGPFCGSAFFTAADPPPGPTWLDPTNGQTIGLSSYTGVISTPSLDKSEWTLYADNAGAISSTVLQGPVTVTTGDLRSHTFTGLANNVPVWWSVRTSSGGLWSQPVQIRTPVSYTPPAAPTVNLTPDDSAGSLLVGIINPAPGAGEPTVSYNDVYVDDGQGVGWQRVATMLAPSTDWTYSLPRSGYDYSGHVKVVSVASNGTTSETVA